MSLRSELQKLTTDEVVEVGTSLQERLDSVSPQDLEAEAIAAVTSYPALNQLAILILEQALGEDLPIEEAAQRSVGASQALLILTTIAEIQELPTL